MDQEVRKRLHELGGVELPTDRELFIMRVRGNIEEVGLYIVLGLCVVQCSVMALFGKSCK